MDCEGVRTEGNDLIQCIFHIAELLAGQAQDNIHIDIVEAGSPGHLERTDRVLHGMPSPDQVERLLIHRLRIHGYSGDPMLFQDFQLLHGNGIGSPCLDSAFEASAKIIILLRCCKEPVELLRRKGRRSPPSHIKSDRLSSTGAAADRFLPRFERESEHLISLHLQNDRIHVIVHGSLPGRDRRCAERTVETDRRTERDMQIQAVRILTRRNPGEDPPFI